MAEFARYDKGMPCGKEFCENRTGLWMLVEGKIEVHKFEEDENAIHADVWGTRAWGTPERGYLFDPLGLITCHGGVSAELEKKLARKFKDACYLLDYDFD
jgi:hypothetical protein